jgi:hypothetical protein
MQAGTGTVPSRFGTNCGSYINLLNFLHSIGKFAHQVMVGTCKKNKLLYIAAHSLQLCREYYPLALTIIGKCAITYNNQLTVVTVQASDPLCMHGPRQLLLSNAQPHNTMEI